MEHIQRTLISQKQEVMFNDENNISSKTSKTERYTSDKQTQTDDSLESIDSRSINIHDVDINDTLSRVAESTDCQVKIFSDKLAKMYKGIRKNLDNGKKGLIHYDKIPRIKLVHTSLLMAKFSISLTITNIKDFTILPRETLNIMREGGYKAEIFTKMQDTIEQYKHTRDFIIDILTELSQGIKKSIDILTNSTYKEKNMYIDDFLIYGRQPLQITDISDKLNDKLNKSLAVLSSENKIQDRSHNKADKAVNTVSIDNFLDNTKNNMQSVAIDFLTSTRSLNAEINMMYNAFLIN